MDTKQLPFNIRTLQAKNEMAHTFRCIAAKYDLPGVVLDLILSELLADERQAHLALICEQYSQVKGGQDADTRAEHESAD